MALLLRPRNYMIRQTKLGARLEVLTRVVLSTPRRCCAAVRFWSLEACLTGLARNGSIRRVGLWSRSASLNDARNSHTATRLRDGSVPVAGGYNDNEGVLGSAELFRP